MKVTSKNRFDIAPDTKLWRYMSFAKFVALLHNKELVLPSANMLDDPFEGASGNANNISSIIDEIVRITAKEIGINGKNQISNKKIRNKYTVAADISNKIGKFIKRFTFISCWHENETESEAMWKLYTANQPEGIAIQTTFKSLKYAINNPQAEIGRVSYEDYNNFIIPDDSFLWYKRKSFEHEREVRVMIEADVNKKIYLLNNKEDIVERLPVDLNLLIDNVYVSPYTKPWIRDLVVEELSKCNINKPVHYSGLNKEPYFVLSLKQINQLTEEKLLTKILKGCEK